VNLVYSQSSIQTPPTTKHLSSGFERSNKKIKQAQRKQEQGKERGNWEKITP
jgi:hypothetical protein